MSILEPTIASFAKSELRKPKVTEMAAQGPVEIRGTGGSASLLLVSSESVTRLRELRDFVGLFLRTVVELRRSDPSAVILGEVAYVATWDASRRDRFLDGFAEALDASVRTDDPAAVRSYLKAMSAPARITQRPDFDGRVADRVIADLADRLSS